MVVLSPYSSQVRDSRRGVGKAQAVSRKMRWAELAFALPIWSYRKQLPRRPAHLGGGRAYPSESGIRVMEQLRWDMPSLLQKIGADQ